jgi:hypothetical protein
MSIQPGSKADLKSINSEYQQSSIVFAIGSFNHRIHPLDITQVAYQLRWHYHIEMILQLLDLTDLILEYRCTQRM